MSNIYSQNWGRKDFIRYVGHMDQIAGIRSLEGADGMERGARILQVWTGTGLCLMSWPTGHWTSPAVTTRAYH